MGNLNQQGASMDDEEMADGMVEYMTPSTIEEAVACIGRKERGEKVEIFVSSELFADLLSRVVLLECRLNTLLTEG